MRIPGRLIACALVYFVFLPTAGRALDGDYRERDRRLAYRAGYDDGYREGFRHGELDGRIRARFDSRCWECERGGMNQFHFAERGHYHKGLRDGYRDGYRSGYRTGAFQHHHR
jgi:flagellar biosynthesis/type III secretory pathway protein FliH